MALPLTKAQDLYEHWRTRLLDPTDVVSEIELRGLLKDARAAMKDADAEGCGLLWLLIGHVERERGRWAEAIAAHLNAVRYAPHFATAHLALSATYGRAGHPEFALVALENARKLGPGDHEQLLVIAVNSAKAHHELGHEDEADSYYVQAMNLARPDDARDWLRLARLAAGMGYGGDAVEFVARYLCVVQSKPRGDRFALDVIDDADAEHLGRLASLPDLVAAIDAERKEATAPVPEDMKLPTSIRLDAESWARFAALAGLPLPAGA